ncbi:O-antigen ligase family protein [Acidobacteriota bacterium]
MYSPPILSKPLLSLHRSYAWLGTLFALLCAFGLLLLEPFTSVLIATFYAYTELNPVLVMAFVFFGMASITVQLLRRKMKVFVFDSACFLLLLIFAVHMFSGILNDTFPGRSVETTVWCLTTLGLYFLIINCVNTRHRFRFFLWFVIILALLQALSGIAEFVLNFDFIEKPQPADPVFGPMGEIYTRSDGTIADPNVFALYVQLALPFVIGKMFYSKTLTRKLFFFSLGFMITLSMFLSFTRMIYISFLAGCVVVLMQKLNLRNIVVFVVAFLSFMIFLSIKGDLIVARFKSLSEVKNVGQTSGEITGVTVRYNQYVAFRQIIHGHYWFGRGGGNFYTRSARFNPIARPGEEVGNIFLNVIADIGIVGLILYISMYIAMWIRLVKLTKLSDFLGDRELKEYCWSINIALIVTFVAIQTQPGYLMIAQFLCFAFISCLSNIVVTEIRSKLGNSHSFAVSSSGK